MRRAIFVALSLLLLVTAGAAAVVILRDDHGLPLGPLPNRKQLRGNGFAVWPEDTLAEGMEACEEPESWRVDPQETAFRFARDVLEYPNPRLNTDPIGDLEPTPWEFRYLIGSKNVRGVFLGSVVDVRQYDRCWFVVWLEPREGGWLPSVGFAGQGDRTQLVLQTEGSAVEIGYGSWQRQVADNRDQVVLDLPDLEADATGHIMRLSDYKQVRDGDAAPLGVIPQPATTPVTRLSWNDLANTPRSCRRDDAYRHPSLALADLYTFTFDSAVSTRGRRVLFARGEGARHVSDDRWSLRVDRAELEARIPKLRKGCSRVLSFSDGRRRILESLRLEPHWLTFDLRWRNATSATVTVSTSRAGGGWTFDRFDEPLTVRNYEPGLVDEPMEVTVVLRDRGKVVSAEHMAASGRWIVVTPIADLPTEVAASGSSDAFGGRAAQRRRGKVE